MLDKIILYTQIGTILTYIGSLFYIYQVLVKQKNATIETLQTTVELLKERNLNLKESSPDVLVDRLKKKLDILSVELKALNSEDSEKQGLLNEKEGKLKEALNTIAQYDIQLKSIKELMKEYLCPYCEAPQIRREYHMENKEGVDIDYELVEYECGLLVVDNKIENECTNKR